VAQLLALSLRQSAAGPAVALGRKCDETMSAVVVSERSLRDMVRTLRGFEGPRCLWRVPVAFATLLLIRGLPVVAAVLIALTTIHGRIAQAALSAVIVLVFDGLAKKLRSRLPWRAAVAHRLWTFEKPHPATEVPVLVRWGDVRAAQACLRSTQFNPQYVVRLGSPPSDAVDLDCKIGVHEPEAWPQSTSDEDRTRRIVAVMQAAGIRARVAGTDVVPGAGEGPNG
jgi:hypothetical protein